MAKILYITHNGITDHIGQSQIAPYCLGLAELGHDIHIVSAEKPGRDLLRQRYQAQFDARSIRWSTVTYHNRPPLISSFVDVMRMRRLALRIAADERPALVHCRSYLPIPIGVEVKRRTGAKLLIDFRHFWVEAGLEDQPFKFVYKTFKRWEPGYFAAADHVVTLTRRAAAILDGWYPSAEGLGRFTVIPCCADFNHFDTTRVDDEQVRALREKLGFAPDDFVLLYLGSLGPDYLLREMMLLFRELLMMRPGAKFLFVSNNGEEQMAAMAKDLNLPADSIRFTTVPRDEVPAYLKLTDLSVFFYRADLSRAGCSPTKLAELLAADVPVIGNSGVGDLDDLLSLDRNCSMVVTDFAPASLRRALEQVMAVPRGSRDRIRAASGEYRTEEGVRRYAEIYRKLTGDQPAALTDTSPAVGAA
jgi:glycosyltransferase involved in cell wall biosynthesis